MATVTGYTAEKLEQIMNETIVSGTVVGDDLMLIKQNGAQINAGNVRGLPGLTDLTEWLDLADPPGTPKPYEHGVLPAGHGWCDAETEYDGATYPKLAAIFLTGVDCVNGVCDAGNFRLPNHKGKFMVARDSSITVFDTIRETGGSKDSVVVQHNHIADQPSHTHTADQASHNHGGTTTSNGDHFHLANVAQVMASATGSGHSHTGHTGYIAEAPNDGVVVGTPTAVNVETSGSHFHNIPASDPDISIGNADPTISVNNEGVSGTDKNLPPYRVVNVIMRLT